MSFEFACKRIIDTDMAILVFDYATETEIWIPKSQIIDEPNFDGRNEGTITIPEWLAKEKGLM